MYDEETYYVATVHKGPTYTYDLADTDGGDIVHEGVSENDLSTEATEIPQPLGQYTATLGPRQYQIGP
jgi:hypothetical protein